MTQTQITKKIISDLHHLGIAKGDVIMVHSSIKSLGKYDLNPETIVEALLAAIGTNGTLLMPALTFAQKPNDVHSTRDTPSNVGALPEYFRLRKGTIRSLHPTHSVCGFGPAANELLKDHQKDSTPCGPFSPFSKILNINAKIVMLGCGLEPNTTMHAIEELVEPPYYFGDFCKYKITDNKGKEFYRKYKKHGFEGLNQRYDKIKLLDSSNLFCKGKVLDAETFVINTKSLKKAVLSKLKDNPLFFVEKKVVENFDNGGTPSSAS